MSKKQYYDFLCACGCGQEGKYQFKNGKWCCSDHYLRCPESRKKNIGRISPRKGKTYEEIFGEERASEVKKKISKNSARLSGKDAPMFNKTHTEEAKKKISEAISGENNGMYNKKHSKKTLRKISCSCKITLNKQETKEKLIQANSGENNPNWKGGISCEPYCEIWVDQDYKDSIKKRDGYRCLNPECNKTCNVLSVHHINYIKKDCNLLNLITICVSCNAKANKEREWHRSWYQAIIERRYCE